ncbi:CDP-alcohol phosphatidyltransferase family protein [Promethearchaeum syntrophicum]|uniref:CDP-alcohol phosphatidyltransferase family protein n=1 Tax=Promethearchaeum syntrophicum TaxID=2594042 RepID=A0A5B9DBL1_9ARCH|nr:CDP-alcohol phosphatidyltransferase family protein [Candidatus Prometheoarchaeum syntrophicum]QEE16512.1 CDP-alcohol phosphatidyltransferase [Candidatus Prometheoarchaeum syntrophicum]
MNEKLKTIDQDFKKGLKPQGELINNILYRPLSYPFVLLSAKLKLSPNFITFLSFLSSILSAIFFGIGRVYLGALFFFLRQYFDCSDGALARITNNFSKFGAMFDAIGDGVGVLMVMLAITIEQYIRLGTSIVFLFLVLALLSNFLGLFYYYSVKSRYFKGLRAGQQNEKLSSKTEHNSLINFFGFDSESEVKLKFFEKNVEVLTPFPNIENLDLRNSENNEMTIEEKQQLFKKSFSYIPLLWSLMAGASQSTMITIIALFNRLDDILWFVLIIGWNLLVFPLTLIQYYAFKRFNARNNLI